MKNKITKICFYISFIPYASLYFFSLRAYWTGWHFLFGGSWGWEAVKNTFSFYLIFFFILFILSSLYQLSYGINNFGKRKGYFIAAIIPVILTIAFFVYCLFPFQSQFTSQNTWKKPTSEQTEKIYKVNSILSDDTGYEITFLESQLDIDDYSLSEMNKYIRESFDYIYTSVFIHTDDISIFDVNKCMENFCQLYEFDNADELLIFIYEDNGGEIKRSSANGRKALKMKEVGTSKNVLRGDVYSDDKILIRLPEKEIEYGSFVNNRQ